MVLLELGQKITGALKNFQNHTTIGEEEIDLLLKDIGNALMQSDVNFKVVMKLRSEIKAQVMLSEDQGGYNKRKIVQKAVFDAIKHMLDPGVKPYQPKKGHTNVIMFVGMQGAGKTTSCTKYAAYYQKKGFKVALVCADTFRAGAYDQLKQNALKARVRFYGSFAAGDPVALATEAVQTLKAEGVEVIIVDTSGRHKQEEALFVEMKDIQEAINPNDIVYVLDSTNGQTVQEQAMAFKKYVPVGSIILTKLDGHAKGGGALSAIAITQSPVIFIGVGEHYDDFELFNPQSFVSRMLGFGDVEGLVNVIKTSGIDEKSELYKRFTEGTFTLRDMYEHLENVMKLGPMGKVLDMIPGFSMSGLKGREEESSNHLKVFINIMDSMNDEELDSANAKKMLTAARINRIARGSGRSPLEVNELIKAYNKFEEMVKKIGKMNFKQMSKDPSAMTKHTGQEQMNKLARAMDPQMLKRIGGPGGLQQMMKQFSQFQ
jgi:signal recognition particle subunit SRP54